MNLIEQLFNDFNAKYLEEAKNRNIDLGLQTVYTPIDKIEKATGFRFADHITAETKSVAVLFNTEFINYFIKELPQDYINNIKFTFFYDCKFDYMQVQDCIFFSGNKLNIEMISIENIKDLDKVMAGKKFDIVFSNPPYTHALDIKILLSIKKIVKTVIFIHPAMFALDKKFKSSCFNEIRNLNALEKILLFWGNKIFNIGLFMPLCISKWNFEKNDKMCDVIDKAFENDEYNCEINNISIYGFEFMKIKKFKERIDSIIKNNGSFVDHRTLEDYSNLTNYSVKFSILRGHPSENNGINKDFFSLICLNENENYCDNTYRTNIKGYKFNLWSFNNENERKNFIKYCKTKVIRFCFSFYKMNANINSAELEALPWLDFTQEWNDAKLCKEFGISEELWNYIDNFIPDYYEDYESGFGDLKTRTVISIKGDYEKVPQEILNICNLKNEDIYFNENIKGTNYCSNTIKINGNSYNIFKDCRKDNTITYRLYYRGKEMPMPKII